MTTRRGFLVGMMALGAAPAIVRAASLMPVITPSGLIVPSGAVLTLDAVRRAAKQLMANCIVPIDGTYIVFFPHAADPFAQRGIPLAEAARRGWHPTDGGVLYRG